MGEPVKVLSRTVENLEDRVSAECSPASRQVLRLRERPTRHRFCRLKHKLGPADSIRPASLSCRTGLRRSLTQYVSSTAHQPFSRLQLSSFTLQLVADWPQTSTWCSKKSQQIKKFWPATFWHSGCFFQWGNRFRSLRRGPSKRIGLTRGSIDSMNAHAWSRHKHSWFRVY